jgi:hypothetical protein
MPVPARFGCYNDSDFHGEVYMPMLHGSCLCRGVRFEITGPLRPARNCHCSMCRKQQGAAFRSAARISAADLRWIKAKIWSNSTSRLSARSEASVASAAPRSSTNSTSDQDRRHFGRRPYPNTASRWRRSMTTPACARGSTSLSAARRHGSRSPTVCLSTRITHRLARNAAVGERQAARTDVEMRRLPAVGPSRPKHRRPVVNSGLNR